MKHHELTNNYIQFIESFAQIENEDFDLKKNDISEAIFKHIFQIKIAQWKKRIQFNRLKKISISDTFQDIIALYLKISLSDNFEVFLEKKSGKLQPDILIQYNGDNLFILEIKTNIGWDRDSLNGGIADRIYALATEFNIPEKNVVYIFLNPWNVKSSFRSLYYDHKNDVVQPLPTEFPFSQIRPILKSDDPYYWKQDFDKQKNFKEYSKEEIDEKSKKNIVIPLEITIQEIITAANIG